MTLLRECIPYVCPEPALVKKEMIFSIKWHRKRSVFPLPRRSRALRGDSPSPPSGDGGLFPWSRANSSPSSGTKGICGTVGGGRSASISVEGLRPAI
jgi:hypothetical protein